jgi:phosphoserine phosphatase
VTFDIDGTLTIGHGWYYIAGALGRIEDYSRYTKRYRAGKSSESEHLCNLLNLAGGKSVESIRSIVKQTPKLLNIRQSVRMLRENDIESLLLTHNPQYICEWYEENFGFAGHYSAFQTVNDGTIGMAVEVFPDKVSWLNELCADWNVHQSRVIHVGDSLSDAAVFLAAGGGIAVNSRNRKVTGSATAMLNTTDMKDVARLILGLSD